MIKVSKKKTQPKRNFHEEIRPEKRSDQIEDLLTENSKVVDNLKSQLEDKDGSVESGQTQQKLTPEQVPFKDLESLFVK